MSNKLPPFDPAKSKVRSSNAEERGTFEVTTSNGRSYTIDNATEEDAAKIGAWMEQRIAAGDEDFQQEPFPIGTFTPASKQEYEGVDYINTGGIEGLVNGEGGEKQIDRGGFLAGLDSVGRGIARGFTGNYADEIAAGVNAVLPIDALTGKPVESVWSSEGDGFWDKLSNAYNHNFYLENQIDKADDTQNPVLSGGGKLAGTVAQYVTGARALKAAAPGVTAAIQTVAKAAPLRTSAAVGTATGALQGTIAGSGEGDTLEERTKNAKFGGTFGGVLGGTVSPVVTGLAPAVGRYARVLFGSRPDEEATAQLIQALQRDGFDVTSPAGVKALKDELSSYLGKPVSLADIGNATRARAGVGLRVPSAAQSQGIDTVLQRQAGQGQRLASDIRNTVAPRTDVHALDEALIAEREAAAMPLRDKALFEEGPGFGTPATAPRDPLVAPTGLATGDAPDAGLRRMLGLNTAENYPTYQKLGVLTPEEEAAVRTWHGGHDAPISAAELNAKLRSGAPLTPKQEQFYQTLKSAFSKQPPLEEGMTVYRGVADDASFSTPYLDELIDGSEKLPPLVAGDAMPIPHPISTTYDRRMAKSFTPHGNNMFDYDELANTGSTLMRIDVPAGVKVIKPGIGAWGDEGEVILPPGAITPNRVRAANGRRVVFGSYTPEEAARQARIPTDPQLQQLARLPFAQRALQQSRALAQEEASLKAVLGQDISHLPDVARQGADLDMRTFDYMKRFLDAEVNKLARGADTNTYKAAEYAQVKQLRDALRERMRAVVPEYGDYLDTYRGSSEMLDALREGRGFRSLDPEQIAAEQAKRSEAAQELYRVGVARDLFDTMGATRDGANPASRILNSPESRDQLAATGVTPENATLLNRSVDIERQFNKLPAELAGSQTAQRAAAQADADAGAHATLPFNPGSPLGWAGALARAGLNRASIVRNAQVNEALLPRMLQTDMPAIMREIDQLEAAGRLAEAAKLRRAVIAARAAGTVGGLVGTNSAVDRVEGY